LERQLAEAGLAPVDSNVVIAAGAGSDAAGGSVRARAAGYLEPWKVALLCVMSVVVTALLAGVGVLLVHRRKQQKQSSEMRVAADAALPANYV
jgi:hypothetical protein